MKTAQICPECKSTQVKKIIYGLPAHDLDFDKYESGGCCVTDSDPKYKCMKCERSW